MKVSQYFLLLFFLTINHLAHAQNNFGKDKHIQRIAFYNVENLFDTNDDIIGRDEEFLPTSEKKWTPERYQKKLNQLAQVFAEMEFPNIIGLCEVENMQTLRDLTEQTALKKEGYGIVHFESPDYRGIDVALLYKKKCFEVTDKSFIRINFPTEIVENYTTRDVLIVKGILHKRDEVYFFVNHWPSRRGGLSQSSPKREYVAAQVRRETDKILAADPQAKIILMGDFNDEPDNKSVAEVLIKDARLHNAMTALDERDEGTYNYRGNWNMIDQFIVSEALTEKNAGLQLLDAYILRRDYLFYDDKKYGKTPTRTYGGKRYFGGYSDHLPIYLDLRQMSKKERKAVKAD